MTLTEARSATIARATKETDISGSVTIDGTGASQIETGIGFLDHMLTALSKHSEMDIVLRCKGDLHIDDHHTSEDCALALGKAIDEALGDRAGITRFGSSYAPLDESLARVVVDFSGRAHATVELCFTRAMVGTIATENLTHFFESLASAARMTLHVDLIRGSNDHHKAEAAFKALALSLKAAVKRTGGDVPSTKGVL
ncbi:MAG: imidazoleglycerol-phosphate dehydratase HisB [Planctomycetota bacterium]